MKFKKYMALSDKFWWCMTAMLASSLISCKGWIPPVVGYAGIFVFAVIGLLYGIKAEKLRQELENEL